MKLWGGRFSEASSDVFERFSESLSFDRRLIAADVRGSKTYARALHDAGILDDNECSELLLAFDQILAEAEAPGYFDGADDEDIHTFVIRKLGEKAGVAAEKIHTGRSRNEQVSVDVRLWLRDEIDNGLSLLHGLMESLVAAARRHPDALIPGYTHLRRAQAVLWPHYLLAYLEAFMRDFERLEQVRSRTNLLPLGSGALAGSAFQFDREKMARELEFEGVTRNSMDVSADRDFVLDYLYAGSMVMVHLSRMCEDWILYSSEEFGWLELGDGVTSGSSLMPQKKNPDSLELIRGKSGRVWGSLNSLYVTLKGLPMTYNRDLQEDKIPLFEAVDQVNGCLEMMRAVVDTVKLNTERPSRAAAEGWLVATDLAEALARNGTPFHRAHQIVGRLVLTSVEAGKLPADWSPEELAAFAPEFTPEMAALMDPAQGMKTREVPGATGPSVVASALDEAERRLAELAAERKGTAP